MPEVDPVRLIIKALVLFTVFNVLLVAFPSTYHFVFNLLMPKLDRFPMYAVTYDPSAKHGYGIERVVDVRTLFNSHVISRDVKAQNEYRVIFIGDSTIRNGLFYSQVRHHRYVCGKDLQFYNLGYYGASAAKDLMIMQEAMKYSPDLILWSVTNSITSNDNDFLQANPGELEKMDNEYGFSIPYNKNDDYSIGMDSAYYRTQAQLRVEGRLLLYYFFLYPATGNNEAISEMANRDAFNALSTENTVSSPPVTNPRDILASDLRAFQSITDNISAYLINEPRPGVIVNSEAYKQYLADLTDLSNLQGIKMKNLATLIPDDDFTTLMIHRDYYGDTLFAQAVIPAILKSACTPK